MPKASPQSSDSTSGNSSRTLTDRVKERVAEASVTNEEREKSTGSKSRKLRPTKLGTPSSGPKASEESQREGRSLRRVYRELKGTYQQYRRETGRQAVPALRDAVRAFKRGPSLKSLVGVAAFLDDRSLLPW
jgi:hypothetical protein